MTSEIEEIYSKISTFLLKGPAFTVDIAEYIGKDTTQTSAILDYYVGKGDIGKTERRYGTSALYYLKNDLDKAANKLYQTLGANEKAVVNKIKSAKVVKSQDLAPAERYLTKSLTDFVKSVSAVDSETKEKVDYLYYYQVSLDEIKTILNPPQRGAIKGLEKTRQREHKDAGTETKRKIVETAAMDVQNTLSGLGFSNASKIEPDVYYCDYGQNQLKVIVIFSKKASLTKKDFIKFAGYAESYKTVCFVVSGAKKMEDYSRYGNIIKVLRAAQ